MPRRWTLFAGFDRLETGFPVDYPTSSSPHAWAAGSVLLLIRITLGLEPAPATGSQQIMARPVLPPGIGRLRVAGLRLNGAALDLELRRVGGDVRLDVLRSPAGISVRRAA